MYRTENVRLKIKNEGIENVVDVYKFNAKYTKEQNLELTMQLLGYDKKPKLGNDTIYDLSDCELIPFDTGIKLDLSKFTNGEFNVSFSLESGIFIDSIIFKRVKEYVEKLKAAVAKNSKAVDAEYQAGVAATNTGTTVVTNAPTTETNETAAYTQQLVHPIRRLMNTPTNTGKPQQPAQTQPAQEQPKQQVFVEVAQNGNQPEVVMGGVAQQPVQPQQPVQQAPQQPVQAQSQQPVQQVQQQPVQQAQPQRVEVPQNTIVAENVSDGEICYLKGIINLGTIPHHIDVASRVAMIKRLYKIFTTQEVLAYLQNKQPQILFNVVNFISYDQYELESYYPLFKNIKIAVRPLTIEFGEGLQ